MMTPATITYTRFPIHHVPTQFIATIVNNMSGYQEETVWLDKDVMVSAQGNRIAYLLTYPRNVDVLFFILIV